MKKLWIGIFDAVPAITKVIIKYILIILELLFIAVLEERWSTVRYKSITERNYNYQHQLVWPWWIQVLYLAIESYAGNSKLPSM